MPCLSPRPCRVEMLPGGPTTGINLVPLGQLRFSVACRATLQGNRAIRGVETLPIRVKKPTARQVAGCFDRNVWINQATVISFAR